MRLQKQLGDFRCAPSAIKERVQKESTRPAIQTIESKVGLRKSMDFVKNARQANTLLTSGLLDWAILCEREMKCGKLMGKSKAEIAAGLDLTEEELDQQLARLG